jgi:hypothetical protein
MTMIAELRESLGNDWTNNRNVILMSYIVNSTMRITEGKQNKHQKLGFAG